MAIPIVHVRWQRRYDSRALAEQLAAAMGIAASARQPVPPATFVSSREPIPVAATPLVPAAPAQAPVLPVAARVVDAPALTMAVAPAPAAPSLACAITVVIVFNTKTTLFQSAGAWTLH